MIPHCKENVINQNALKTKADSSFLNELKGSLAQTIEDSCTTKLDQRILKNIDSGTQHIAELTAKLKDLSLGNHLA